MQKVVFFGTPNAGTPLADAEYLATLLDVLTNIVSMAPSMGAIDVLECVIEIVKEVATGIAVELSGLQSMHPKGEFLKKMNDAPKFAEPIWHAVTSSYTPQFPEARARWVLDKLLDRAFKEHNDLVVPTRAAMRARADDSQPRQPSAASSSAPPSTTASTSATRRTSSGACSNGYGERAR